jgi:hypothetical protein
VIWQRRALAALRQRYGVERGQRRAVESATLRDAAILILAAKGLGATAIASLRGRDLQQEERNGSLLLSRAIGVEERAQMRFTPEDQELLLEYAESWSVWAHAGLPLFRGYNGPLTARRVKQLLFDYREGISKAS